MRTGFCISKLVSIMFVLQTKMATVEAKLVPRRSTVKAKTTIFISFDGFRWDYMSKTSTPNLDYLVKTGVKASYINPVFPTETIPNHYSMVTGLYPESHGIISGYYTYDPVWNSTFDLNTTESRWWDGGEPVWVTNQRQGYRSGVCFYPGYDVKIRGYFPSFSSKDLGYGKAFLQSKNYMSFQQQVDLVISWMKVDNPPSFIAVYFNEPDEDSHRFGPDSHEVIQQIQRCDNITGYLVKRLTENDFIESTNLVIASDHGHAAYNTSFFLNFDDYISQEDYTRHGLTTIQIWPKEESNLDNVYNRFKKMENETHRITVYKIEDLPDNFHFKNNRRTPPIVGLMEEHWVGNNSGFWRLYWKDHNNITDRIHGDHGYNPELQSMKPFFIAKGPSFKEGFVSKPFDNVDIYPLLCHVLGIIPAPNNGSFSNVQQLLKVDPAKKNKMISNTWSEGIADFLVNAWQEVIGLM